MLSSREFKPTCVPWPPVSRVSFSHAVTPRVLSEEIGISKQIPVSTPLGIGDGWLGGRRGSCRVRSTLFRPGGQTD